jgi:hypothetical protein
MAQSDYRSAISAHLLFDVLYISFRDTGKPNRTPIKRDTPSEKG